MKLTGTTNIARYDQISILSGACNSVLKLNACVTKALQDEHTLSPGRYSTLFRAGPHTTNPGSLSNG